MEVHGLALAALKKNVVALAPAHAAGVVRARVEDYLSRPAPFDIVFADPPFQSDPDGLTRLVPAVLAPGGIFLLRHRTKRIVAGPPGMVKTIDRRYGDSVLVGYERERSRSEDQGA